ncbi:MAG TPA: ABC transporter ATP-binding protein, partial [Spirochaetia bacterium]|nr:ABC transporter ATP-binding protein [Spirochaetia bacterium]
MADPVAELSNLQVTFGASREAVRGVDLRIGAGEIHALVGESGSGKTVTSKAIIQLLPEGATVSWDRLMIDGREFTTDRPDEVRGLRGRRVAMIFQEPGKHLNPAMTIGRVITEAVKLHLGLDRPAALARGRELMDLVELDRDVLSAYPHELSGGMKQRALIALAVSCSPVLLLADEPTTALDVTVQAQILALLDRLRRELGMSILFVSHDLGLVQSTADRVSVMYAGRIVDTAPSDELFAWPLHPYTDLLLESIPSAERRGERLRAIPGRVPDAGAVPSGCAFHPRCPIAVERCA